MQSVSYLGACPVFQRVSCRSSRKRGSCPKKGMTGNMAQGVSGLRKLQVHDAEGLHVVSGYNILQWNSSYDITWVGNVVTR
jgi:hypothetical protein